MTYHNKHVLIAIILFAMSNVVFAGSSAQAEWPVYKGDTVGYYSSHLPTPVVIYVFERSGGLVGTIETEGKYTSEAMGKVKAELSKKSFLNHSNEDLLAISGALKNYLADQGYRLSDVIDRNAAYTLLFVDWSSKRPQCGWMEQAVGQYKHAMNEFVQQRQKSKEVFAAREMQLSSDQVKVSCRKKS